MIVALGVALGQPGPAAAQTPPPVVDPRFGAIEAWMAPEQAAALRVGWDRMLLDWYQYQPESAEQWAVPPNDAARVTATVAAGREMVILLRGTPPWATDGPPYGGVPRGLFLPLDDPGNVWARFITRVVTEYAARGVNRWIIWNEPDIAADEYGAQFWGTVTEYYQLVKVAYQAAKRANPNAIIHLGGLTHWHDVVFNRRPYLQRFLEVARADPTAAANNYYFDVATVHIYFRTETIAEIIKIQRGILSKFGLRHPIWLNETNAAPADDPKLPWNGPMFAITMDQQAAFVVQAFALGLAAGAERVSIYKLTEINPIIPGADYNGLFRPDGSARPAVAAFRAVTTHFAGARRITSSITPTQVSVRLDRSGAVTRVLWAREDKPITVRLTALSGAFTATLYDHLGRVLPLTTVRRGVYSITLPAGVCNDPRVGCIVEGAPVMLVETYRR